MINKVHYMYYLYYGQSWSIMFFICPICIKNSHGQLGVEYVRFVLMTVMVNEVFHMSYLY